MFSKFIIIIAVIYAAYYSINILIDFLGSKTFTHAGEENNVEFDLGKETGPKKAALDDPDPEFEQPGGGQKQELENQREETLNESYKDRYYGRLGVDLRLEDVLPSKVDLNTERVRKSGQHY